MILGWMAYATVVAVLCGLAALLIEPIVRGRGGATRFVWLAAMGTSAVLPVVARLAPAPAQAPDAVPGGTTALDLAALLQGVGATAPSLLGRLDTPALAAWGAASLLLLAAVTGGLVRLAVRARRWPTARLHGDDVLLSDDFGPAAFGVRAARVVLPLWALALEPAQLRLVVIHEREHGRAGDARSLLVGALVVVAAPWNVALWWQLRRLRAAVEIDCDARVVRSGAHPRAYGRLLLELGARSRGALLAVPGLARPRSLLERRMTMIVKGTRRTGAVATLAGVAVATLLVAMACEAPAPTAVEARSAEAASEAVDPGTVKLRALTEGTGDVSPLVFVDGVRVDGIPADLSPERVARIEVVKGKEAIAAEGPAAAGGVIRIVTKAEGDTPFGEANGAPAGTFEVRQDAPEGSSDRARNIKARQVAPDGSGDRAGNIKARQVAPDGSSERTGNIEARQVVPDGSSDRTRGTIRARQVAPGSAPTGTFKLRDRPSGDPMNNVTAVGKTAEWQFRPKLDAVAEGPVVYVDGVRFEGDPSTLAPETIERIDVERGADGANVIRIARKPSVR